MSASTSFKHIRRGVTGLGAIVLGVLIALAADEWIQAREDRGHGADLIERLILEVREDSAGLESFLSRTGVAEQAGARIIEELEGGVRVPDDSLAQHIRAISYPPVFPQIRRATYVEMTSTGSLALIPFEKRVPVVQYYEELDWQERTMPRATSVVTAPWVYELSSPFLFEPSFEIPAETLRTATLRAPNALQAIRREHVKRRFFVLLLGQMLERATTTLAALEG